MTKEKKQHKIFVDGAISPAFIADSLAAHAKKTNIGAHAMFMGQVRADIVEGKMVQAIEYTCYREMAEDICHEIRESAFAAFDLTCLHIYHSLGEVKTGEICLFVFVSSKHRKAAFEACETIVERIKKELPVWGKEIFTDASEQWKINN